MSTPVDYASRYTNLLVDLDSGPVTVNIHQYHLGAPTGAKDRLWSKLKQHFHDHQKADPKYALRLRVNGGDYEVASYNMMATWVVRPFTGKGNPEHCQVVLQLAVLLGEATAQTLQTYCDSNLGLDCNGFVGNYLYYEDAGHDWMDEPRNGEGGPNDDMTLFERMGKAVRNTEEMTPANTYLCLETLGGKVIPGGSSGAGHIVITEPRRFMARSFVFNSFGGLDMGMARKQAYGHPAFFAVESTSHRGLTQSWYAFPKNKNDRGLHKVFRGSKTKWLDCKVIDLGML